ncbi:unnamed protein product, partial [Prorocentrum cordatum]
SGWTRHSGCDLLDAIFWILGVLGMVGSALLAETNDTTIATTAADEIYDLSSFYLDIDGSLSERGELMFSTAASNYVGSDIGDPLYGGGAPKCGTSGAKATKGRRRDTQLTQLIFDRQQSLAQFMSELGTGNPAVQP